MRFSIPITCSSAGWHDSAHSLIASYADLITQNIHDGGRLWLWELWSWKHVHRNVQVVRPVASISKMSLKMNPFQWHSKMNAPVCQLAVQCSRSTQSDVFHHCGVCFLQQQLYLSSRTKIYPQRRIFKSSWASLQLVCWSTYWCRVFVHINSSIYCRSQVQLISLCFSLTAV